ncbi:hypothetical protein MMC22_010688 [Lobaria immixta]|nr:hypothetical protein [Lobaria immixta]
MADPSTVIGIVGLVGQLLLGLKSLHTFFGDIKDAPSDIQNLTHELSSNEAVLHKILHQLNTINSDGRNTLLETAVRNCVEHVTKLENITRPLQMTGQDGEIKRVWTQIATAFKKEDLQKHFAMLHGARLNIIAAQGAWAIDLHHSHATKTYKLSQSIQTLSSNHARDSAAISNKLVELEGIPEVLQEVKDAVQKDEVLAVSHELNQSFQIFHSTAATKITEMSNKVEHFSKMLGNLNDAVQRNKAIPVAGIEEFPSFMKHMVQAAVNNAIETHFHDTEGLPHCQQESCDICNIVSVEPSEQLRGEWKSVKRSIRSRHYSRTTKVYHFWFGKVRIETFMHDLANAKFDYTRSSSIYESHWHARMLVLPAPWILRKGSLVTLEYIIRENKKTSFQVNIEPIRIIAEDSPIFTACYKGDLKTVRQLMEGGQASRHDRDKNGWTLLHRAFNGLFSGSRIPYRARDIEHLIGYLISVGMDPWEDAAFFFRGFVASTSISRTPPYEIEHIPGCFEKLFFRKISDLLDHDEIAQGIIILSAFDGCYRQFILQLVSRDSLTVKLEEVLSDPFNYLLMGISYGHQSGQSLWENMRSQGLPSLRVKIGKFLDQKSDLLMLPFLAETELMQSYFLEKTIMTGSFFIHHPMEEIHEEHRKKLRHLFEQLLIQSLALLMRQGHCPRGTRRGSNELPDLDGWKFYSPTKIARDLGVLELWREALVRSGHDTLDIIDEFLYAGLIDLFNGLSYQYSAIDEIETVEDDGDNDDDDRHKPGLVAKVARAALAVMSSII